MKEYARSIFRGILGISEKDYLSMKNKSIFDDDRLDRCYLCGKWKSEYENLDEHHVFSGPCRRTSDRYGLVVHICRDCHSLIHDQERGKDLRQFLHEKGQRIYEERIGNRKAFITEFIRSYL